MLNAYIRQMLFARPAYGYDFEDLSSAGYRPLDQEADVVHWIAGPARPKGVLIFFHGNGETALDWVALRASYPELSKWSFVLAEYRGYADPDVPTPKSEEELVADAVTTYEQALGVVGDLPVVVWGRSLGGSVAALLAGCVPVDGLVLESTFYSLADIAEGFIPLPIPRSAIEYIVRRFPLRTGEAVSRVPAPVLVAHSNADCVIPQHQADRIFDKALAPKRRQRLRGDHNTDKSKQRRYRAAIALLCESAVHFHRCRRKIEG